MSEAEGQKQSDPPAPARREAREPGEGAVEYGARTYGARRRGWIRIHGRDDRLLIFIGVLALAGILFLVAYSLVEDWREEDHPPVALTELFAGDAEEIEPGLLRITYDFKMDPAAPEGLGRNYDLKTCPQMYDWQLGRRNLAGRLAKPGILVGGTVNYKPFFVPGELSVECDAAVLTGSKVGISLRSIFDHEEQDYYLFELTASRGPGWPAIAQLTKYDDGSKAASTSPVTLDGLRARRDPPRFYRVRLEMSNGFVRGYFRSEGGKLTKVCELEIGKDHLGAGTVVLSGAYSHTAYDNVVITGRPHPKMIAQRTELYYLFDQHKQKKAPATESAPPAAESAPPAKS